MLLYNELNMIFHETCLRNDWDWVNKIEALIQIVRTLAGRFYASTKCVSIFSPCSGSYLWAPVSSAYAAAREVYWLFETTSNTIVFLHWTRPSVRVLILNRKETLGVRVSVPLIPLLYVVFDLLFSLSDLRYNANSFILKKHREGRSYFKNRIVLYVHCSLKVIVSQHSIMYQSLVSCLCTSNKHKDIGS